LYNNLKGTITAIEEEERIKFTIELERHYEEYDFSIYEIELVEQRENGNSVISFYVNKLKERDEDVDNQQEIVPFQIAYAVSIHKAQGLEYDSVKVVITKDI
jgi:ATP-dependent exoDNAse (exonuclease V) alpha subunit